MAAEQDDAQAQYLLGTIHSHGARFRARTAWMHYLSGIKTQQAAMAAKQLKKAVEMYTKSAQQGLACAQFNLGVCFKNGKGTEQNAEMAMEWFKRAAGQGHVGAQCNVSFALSCSSLSSVASCQALPALSSPPSLSASLSHMHFHLHRHIVLHPIVIGFCVFLSLTSETPSHLPSPDLLVRSLVLLFNLLVFYLLAFFVLKQLCERKVQTKYY